MQRRGLWPAVSRRGVAVAPLILIAGLVGAIGPATNATAFPPARTLPHRAVRLIRVGPSGAVYRLSNGAHMAVSPDGVAHVDSQATGSLLTFGWIRAHHQKFGVVVQAVTGPPSFGSFLWIDIGTGEVSKGRFAFQDHGYEFDALGTDWVHVGTDLSSGGISTGTLMGAWGAVDVSYTAEGPPKVHCRGNSVTRPASMTGTVEFSPQEDNGFFGTIRSIHVRRSVLQLGECVGRGGGGGHGRQPCPSQPVMADANQEGDDSFVDFFGSTFRGGHKSTENVNYQQFIGDVSVLHENFVQVSPDGVRMRKGQRVTITAFPGTFMTGSATLLASGPADKDGPYPCGKGKHVTFLTYDGTMSGQPGAPLTADFVTGSVGVPESPDFYYGFLGKEKIRG